MATGDWLLLRLPSTPGEAPSWVATDASGALLPDASTGADLPTLAQGRQVALLLPAAEVALFSVQLPAGNEARLQQLAAQGGGQVDPETVMSEGSWDAALAAAGGPPDRARLAAIMTRYGLVPAAPKFMQVQ